jgi:DMSO/TMAO reductase YedYZ molybdopterin-dependent catalytic subunit
MSTGLWSGVPLRTVLHKCGVKRVTNEAQFLHFAGPPKQAPGKGVDGSVGMCLPLAMCLDESNDILIAYELNHLPLGPDQGAPLRMIVPGLVGNYSVKHLSSMRVAKEHSDNFFFLRETTRLPLHVPDAAQATKEKLWGTSEYRVTHAQLNSVVSSPAHNDVVMLQEHGSVTLKGFAYAGKRVQLAVFRCFSSAFVQTYSHLRRVCRLALASGTLPPLPCPDACRATTGAAERAHPPSPGCSMSIGVQPAAATHSLTPH